MHVHPLGGLSARFRSSLLLVAQVILSQPASANPGDLDPTFGTNGQVLTDLGSASISTAHAVAVRRRAGDARPGSAMAAADFDFALVRYDTSGSLDTTFGSGGKVLTNFGSSSLDVANAVAIQPDGKIVAAGVSDAGTTRDFALVRYNTDGSLDTSFGSGRQGADGLQRERGWRGHGLRASQLRYEPDGKLIAAGAEVSQQCVRYLPVTSRSPATTRMAPSMQASARAARR